MRRACFRGDLLLHERRAHLRPAADEHFIMPMTYLPSAIHRLLLFVRIMAWSNSSRGQVPEELAAGCA